MQTIFLTNEERAYLALEIPRGVTALVGGGGKTTLMLRLAREISKDGARVIVTTTTHIFPPEGIHTQNPSTLEEAERALRKATAVCFGKPTDEGKLTQPDLPISAMERIADYILVEADGAKRLPLKAPAEHEPVIPREAKLVIAVAGLDGIGSKIRDAAFRPALYAALCGKAETDLVTPRDLALVLAHENGQRKNVPNYARFAVLLNKADDADKRKAALQTAAELMQYAVERVAIASLREK